MIFEDKLISSSGLPSIIMVAVKALLLLICVSVIQGQSSGLNETSHGQDRNRFDIEEILALENKTFVEGRKEENQEFPDIFATILAANERFNESIVARKGGVSLFQGDIISNKDTDEIENNSTDVRQESSRQKRAAIKDKRYLWPKRGSYRVIPYVITSSNAHAKSKIWGAMKEWERKVRCLKFVNRVKESSYLSFFSGGGCYSMVGRQGRKQVISIGRGCEHHGVIVHEIGHALGFWHEQSRPDRDRYVIINWGAISKGKESNFNKYSSSKINSYNQRYDYGSVMHYGAYAFSIDKTPTIRKKDGSTRGLGQRNGLSVGDVRQANLMYCGGRITPKPKPRPKPTQKPTTCRDKKTDCPGWASKGYCKDPRYKSYMTTNCCQSCRRRPVPTARPACSNKNTNCRDWALRGFCTDARYKSYMARNCCQSCRSRPVPTCRNKNSKCREWAAQGYCTNSTYRRYMRENCCQSCPN